MACKSFLKKKENCILTLLFLGILLLVSAIRYDYYFDLNDDVLMKDILAGVYTGEPEGHNIQMLWLISALISVFYRVVRVLPWYGMFLCFCHFLSIGLIVHRSLLLTEQMEAFGKKNRLLKGFLFLTELFFALSFLMPHLVCAQYTVTCSMLAAAAAFLFLTTDITLPAGAFIRRNIGTVLLVFLAYLIRSEMLLLLLPLICAAGVIKWSMEKKIFTREHMIKYLSVIGLILLSVGIGQGTHKIAYGSSEWQKFNEFFDNRTELYDFQILPEYEANKEFYESIGLTEMERELLANYNFGLDEEIDEDLVLKVADYAASIRQVERPFQQNLLDSLKSDYRRMCYGPSHNESDYPWNYMVILAYVAVLVLSLTDREKKMPARTSSAALRLGFLFAVRMTLWLWLIMRDRVPVRISHSMYFMELCILFAFGLILWIRMAADDRSRKTGSVAGVICLAAVLLYSVMALPFTIRSLDLDTQTKAERNLPYQELYQYLRQQSDDFYFIDVYSSVGYTEKMFVDVDNSLANYDIMGGWACKSPLQRKKLAAFGISNMEEALLTQDNVYYVQEKGADTRWLIRYYRDHGREITLIREKALAGFEIYSLQEMAEGKAVS
ncbi:MAG: hypothetical protein ACLSHX_13055 [Suilimivivens sp.]